MTTANWAATAAPGQIVAFRFPLAEGGQSRKPRPCLILARHDWPGGARLTLAYGTSAWTDANSGLELRVSSSAEAAAAGLDRPSRFVLSRRITVPASDPASISAATAHRCSARCRPRRCRH